MKFFIQLSHRKLHLRPCPTDAARAGMALTTYSRYDVLYRIHHDYDRMYSRVRAWRTLEYVLSGCGVL